MSDQIPVPPSRLNLKALLGSGGKIWRFALRFLGVGLVLNILFPVVFKVGGPSHVLGAISFLMLIPGL